jgi:hypothetical protein
MIDNSFFYDIGAFVTQPIIYEGSAISFPSLETYFQSSKTGGVDMADQRAMSSPSRHEHYSLTDSPAFIVKGFFFHLCVTGNNSGPKKPNGETL